MCKLFCGFVVILSLSLSSVTCVSSPQIFRLQHSPHVIPGPLGQLQATGFGDVYFGQSVTMGFIQVRRIHENECDDIICKNDLESNRDIYKIAAEKAVSYRLEFL